MTGYNKKDVSVAEIHQRMFMSLQLHLLQAGNLYVRRLDLLLVMSKQLRLSVMCYYDASNNATGNGKFDIPVV